MGPDQIRLRPSADLEERAMIVLLSETTPRARRCHCCYDCHMTIPIGEVHYAQTCKQDDQIYTLRSHSDCRAAALDHIADGYPTDYEDGVPPLCEMIFGGDGQRDLDAMRGYWPHVVCRIELRQELADNMCRMANRRDE